KNESGTRVESTLSFLHGPAQPYSTSSFAPHPIPIETRDMRRDARLYRYAPVTASALPLISGSRALAWSPVFFWRAPRAESVRRATTSTKSRLESHNGLTCV